MFDLDDPEALSGLHGERLRRLAATGATIRSLARQALPSHAELSAVQVGACAVLVSDRLPVAYAEALCVLLDELGAPLAASPTRLDASATFPRAADVVVIVSVTGGESVLQEALRIATARGASTIVAAPESSPIARYASERRSILATFDDDHPATSWWAAYAATVAAWRGSAALERLAARLDEVAAQVGPVTASYRNPAKQLAAIDDPLLLIATDRATVALAVILENELSTSNRNVRCLDVRRGFGDFADLGASANTRTRDVFYDPQIDGLTGTGPDWQLVLLPSVASEQLAEDAASAAAAYGAVLAPVLERTADDAWMAAGYVLLAQISGAYRALLRRQE